VTRKAKTSALGVVRDSLALGLRTGNLLLKGIGKALAVSHNALDKIQDGYHAGRPHDEPDYYQPTLNFDKKDGEN